MRRLRPPFAVLAIALLPACAVHGSSASTSETSAAEEGALSGFLSPTVDPEAGTVTLRLPPPDASGVFAECLHVVGLETGLGANDVGLDRGQMRDARLVRFRRLGVRVALELVNLDFRADSGPPEERAAVEQSFATSILFAAEPEERAANGGVTLDVTALLTRDLHGIADTLKSTGEGDYSVDADRSAALPDRCRAFPDNLELAGALTLTSSKAGNQAGATAPDGRALTFIQRQSFLRLPDEGFEPRAFHPRMGAFSVRYDDLSAPLDASVTKAFAIRHRLSVDEPLVYYVDRGAPEPVRSALVEGASWWADAFARAGFPDLFRVEVAPEGLDPLDARYNVIQWVHRSTRGWSYGNAVTDPRTGEIIKGHVSLGSLRVRQDKLLFEGLLGAEGTGSGGPDDPLQIALARIRQLAAHEVGHTLGLAHNFAASCADRASVMDYPAPRVRLTPGGAFDLSDAYGVGVGRWDVHAIRMLYGEPSPGEELQAMYARLDAEAAASGLEYLTDEDARASSTAHPRANLWDDGPDPIAGLDRALAVRAQALENFGVRCLAQGAPLAHLEEVFVPIYLHHRYQVDAALKSVGGVEYVHGTHDGVSPMGGRPVPAADQRRALEALARTLDAGVLHIDPEVAALLLPRPPGLGGSRETFGRATGPLFDALGAADVAARATLRGLLDPARLARIHAQSTLGEDPAFDSLGAYLNRVLVHAGLRRTGEPELGSAVADVVRTVCAEEALAVYLGGRTPAPVRESLHTALRAAADGLRMAGLEDQRARVLAALERGRTPDAARPTEGAPRTPPGSPIGAWRASCGCDWMRFDPERLTASSAAR